MSTLCVALILAYRRFLSPLLPPACRFEPSCSAYGLEAFRRLGFFRGGLRTALRISRCHPWHPGGADPLHCGPLENGPARTPAERT